MEAIPWAVTNMFKCIAPPLHSIFYPPTLPPSSLNFHLSKVIHVSSCFVQPPPSQRYAACLYQLSCAIFPILHFILSIFSPCLHGSVQSCIGHPPLHWGLDISCMWPGWASVLYAPSAPKTLLVPGNSWPGLSFALYGLFLNFCTHLMQVSSLFPLLLLLLLSSLSPGSFLSSAFAKVCCSFCCFFCTEFCISLFYCSSSSKLTAHFLL